MRVFALVFCLVGVAYAKVSLEAVFLAKWSNFKASNGKVYSAEEEPKRLQAFLQNTLHIELHNERHAQGLETFTMGHNEYADLTVEEFKALHTGLSSPPEMNGTLHRVSAALAAPASIDWKSALPAVKNQQSCGSCYSFASIAPLEALLYKKTGKTVSLAEQEIVDCSSSYGNNGCNGGWMSNVYNYIKTAKGVATTSSYAYTASVGTCKTSSTRDGAVSTYRTASNETSLVNALATVGPVAVALQAGVSSFQLYSGGVYNDAACGSGGIDHGVVAVGYGTADGTPYYTIRNSWGTGWGEAGYMRIARTVKHVSNYGYYPVLA